MIEVRDLKKRFGTHSILDGVSFRIEKGESVVIIGRRCSSRAKISCR